MDTLTAAMYGALVDEAHGLLDEAPTGIALTDDNPEYLRAMVELTCRVCGLPTDDWREQVESDIVWGKSSVPGKVL